MNDLESLASRTKLLEDKADLMGNMINEMVKQITLGSESLEALTKACIAGGDKAELIEKAILTVAERSQENANNLLKMGEVVDLEIKSLKQRAILRRTK